MRNDVLESAQFSEDLNAAADKTHLVDGLPPLDHEGKSLSFFEFWPTWLMYLPVVIQWLLLSLKHRSLTLPLLANPKLKLSGMVGVGKSELMETATGVCKESILRWHRLVVSDQDADTQAKSWLQQINQQGLEFPFVCKPDIGCRGSGVKLIRELKQLQSVIESYPENTALLCQKLASWEPEAGVFFVKMPKQDLGEVVSLTLKYNPYVVGDGASTLQELIEKDLRAGNVKHLYYQRHREKWNTTLAKGEILRLVFSASHCRGAVFRDAREHITPALTNKIDQIMSDLPDFYYGRLDIKFSNLDDLKSGKNIEIIEINGASAESIHIWDRNASLPGAIKTLLWQYSTLFQLGAYQRTRGYRTPGLRLLIKHWLKERRLAKHYPLTD